MPPAEAHCPTAADKGAGLVLAVEVHTTPATSGTPHTNATLAAENVMPAMPPEALEHTLTLWIWSPGARLYTIWVVPGISPVLQRDVVPASVLSRRTSSTS